MANSNPTLSQGYLSWHFNLFPHIGNGGGGSEKNGCTVTDEELFRVAATLRGDFIMTYDNAEGVLDLAGQHGFDTQAISMKNTHHAAMTELLISRDLNWMRK